MKTFLLDIADRFRRFDEQLDVKALLCNKSWQVFNDSGVKEIYIFLYSLWNWIFLWLLL